jgi:hypothetical protein
VTLGHFVQLTTPQTPLPILKHHGSIGYSVPSGLVLCSCTCSAAVTAATLTATPKAAKPVAVTEWYEADILNHQNLQEMTPLALAIAAGNEQLALHMLRSGR